MIDYNKYSILKNVNNPVDIKKLNNQELKILAEELREVIIEIVSINGGHLASNLGSIELSLALLKVYNPPEDSIIWDVGHQSYSYKILTERKDEFHTIRKFKGISGFPKISESKYDAYGVGHASTSISAAVGMAISRDIKKEKKNIIAIIGDGAMTGGLAWEGLNHASSINSPITIVLNDNGMSISENVGMISKYLNKLVTAPVYNRIRDDIWELLGLLPSFLSRKARDASRRLEEGVQNFLIPTILFEEMGFRYIGPVNGHDIKEMINVFKGEKKIKVPKIIHVLTQKGHGYSHAEKNPEIFHGIGPFKVESGKGNKISKDVKSWTEEFVDALINIAEKDKKILAITAAMPLGTGLNKFRDKFPERLYDVGIAENHAVTLAAGMATQGLKPAVVIYSTFLQRAYDILIHDIALQNLDVSFFLDRAGLVGEDGPTHHGVFDINYLLSIPEAIIMSPSDSNDLKQMVELSFMIESPTFVRYPRGKINKDFSKIFKNKVQLGKSSFLIDGEEILIIAVGNMVETAMEIKNKLYKDNQVKVSIVNLRFIKPLDEKILEICKNYKLIITLEEGAVINGFGSFLSKILLENGIYKPYRALGIPDKFIEHGDKKSLIKSIELDYEKLSEKIFNIYNSL